MRTAILILVLASVACSSSRKQLERAGALEQRGLLNDALLAYEDLSIRKPKVVEARAGMQRTAQTQLNEAMLQAIGEYTAMEIEAGDKSRSDALRMKLDLQAKGLDLEWDKLVEARRDAAKASLADDLLIQGKEYFEDRLFPDAIAIAERALTLVPGMRDAEYLIKLSKLEPRYLEGRRAEDLGLWREAFGSYEWVYNLDRTFKDTRDRMDAVRDKGRFTMAYVPLENEALDNVLRTVGRQQLEEHFSATMKQAILAMEHPFLVLVDRENTPELLAEQRRTMTDIFDTGTMLEAGQFLGARYVLTSKLLRYDEAWNKQIEVQVKVMDAENGRILLADVVRVSKEELVRGSARAQLLQGASQKTARRLSDLDPTRP